VADFQLKLLRKVEELTLPTLAQQDQIDALRKESEAIRKEMTH
jgi:hypothetical protein